MNAIILLGPTAVGKSKLAIEIAKELNGEIISADSMQVYRGMDIGTAKPTLKERQGIPHHLIDIRNPDEPWTVSDFVEQANHLITHIANPIIVGGTGLYLWALIEGFSFPITPADKELRARLEKEPVSTLYARLSTVDLKAAEKIHPNDKKRIIRALEVYELTGKTISELQKHREPEIEISVPDNSKARINSRFADTGTANFPITVSHNNASGSRQSGTFAGSEYLLIGLTLPYNELYPRINSRVDDMIAKGLIDEVKGLLAKGYSKELFSFQALGYKEVVDYLIGKCPASLLSYDNVLRDPAKRETKEEMIEELKKRTRNFARRQMTWFRRFKNVNWFSPSKTKNVLAFLQSAGV